MTQAIHNDSNRNSTTNSDYAHTDSERIKNLDSDKKREARRDANQDLRTVNRAIRELENKDSADQARREALEELKKEIENFLNDLTEATRAEREEVSGVDTAVDTTEPTDPNAPPVTIDPSTGQPILDYSGGTEEVHITAADSTEDRTYILNPADPAPVPGEDAEEAEKTLEQRLIDDGVIDPETKEVIQDVNGDHLFNDADIQQYKINHSLDTNNNLLQRQKIYFDGDGKTKLSIASVDEENKQLTVRIENLETGMITFQTIINYNKAYIIWSNAQVDRENVLSLSKSLQENISIDGGATTISDNVETNEEGDTELDVTRSNGYKAATSEAAFDASRNMWGTASRTDLKPYWKEAITIFYEFYTKNPKGDWKQEFIDKILKKWDEAGLLGIDKNNLIISLVMTMFQGASRDEVFKSFAEPLVDLFENQLMADHEVFDGRTGKALKDAQGHVVMRKWDESTNYKTVILLLEYEGGGTQFGGPEAALELFTDTMVGDPLNPDAEIIRGRWWNSQTNTAALEKLKKILEKKDKETPQNIDDAISNETLMANDPMVDFNDADYKAVQDNLSLYIDNYCWNENDVHDGATPLSSSDMSDVNEFQSFYTSIIDSLLQAMINTEPMPASHIVEKLEQLMTDQVLSSSGEASLGVMAAMILIIMDGTKPQILQSLMKVPGFKEKVRGWLAGFDSSYKFYNPIMEILNRNY